MVLFLFIEFEYGTYMNITLIKEGLYSNLNMILTRTNKPSNSLIKIDLI